jgi:uncharacterized protein YkwD
MKGIPQMKVRFFGLVAFCFALGLGLCVSGIDASHSQTTRRPSTATSGLSDAERDLLNEINQARAHPQTYVSYLEKLKPLFKGKEYSSPGGIALTTNEGWTAVEDAISFLRTAKPQPPLNMSAGLSLAAMKHVKEQSGSGATGHKGADSSFIEQRVKPFGSWQGGIGENLTYGDESARDRILTWLIDDGFPSRGHRRRLMAGDYKVAGVSCGVHPEFHAMCVVTLAGGFAEVSTSKAAPVGDTPAAAPSKSNTNTNTGTKTKKIAKR